MKKIIYIPKFIFILPILIVCSLSAFSTIYQSKSGGSGDYSNNSSWTSTAPPTTLSPTDTVIIDDALILDDDLVINGQLIINSNGSLIGSHKIEIGKPGDDLGEIINHGILTVSEMKIKPKNSIGANDSVPSVENYGYLTINGNFHIGDNDAAGIFINHIGGTTIITGDVHQDNLMLNYDSISIGGTWKNHGGRVDGCGTITVGTIEFDDNNLRKGVLGCINLCNNGNPPIFIIKGGATYDHPDSSFYHLVDIEGFVGTQHDIDPDSTFICGLNYVGQPNVALSVKILNFEVKLIDNNVQLKWSNIISSNNFAFAVERSSNAEVWETIETINPRNSGFIESYKSIDQNPLTGISYYRLRQTDYDGTTIYSKVKSVSNQLKNEINIYPNPATNQTMVKVSGLSGTQSQITIYDNAGHLMQNKVLSQEINQAQFDISQFKSGIYIVKISGSDSIQMKRLVIR